MKTKKTISVLLILILSLVTNVSAEENVVASEESRDILNRNITEKEASDENLFVPGEVVVKLKDGLGEGLSSEVLEGVTGDNNLQQKEIVEESDIAVLEIKDESSVERAVSKLQDDPRVEFAQPNFRYKPFSIQSNDPSRDLQWALENTGQLINGSSGTAGADIKAQAAWNISEGTSSIPIVAIIDNGVAYQHPDILANMWDGTNCVDENGGIIGGCLYGYDFESMDKNPLPDTSGVTDSTDEHGTNIAGIIAAQKNNGVGIAGVAPHAKIMALKFDFTTTGAITAIKFAQRNGAKIINASWGAPPDPTYGPDTALEEAIEAFPGLFITAAGNSGTDNESSHFYPCDYDSQNIICVAATNQNDTLASFSNYGAASVDIAAPGSNIYSTSLDYEMLHSVNFDGVSAPAVPSGFSTTGSTGTVSLGGSEGIVLYGDTNRSSYSANANNTMTSPEYNLSSLRMGRIEFKTTCDTEYSSNWTDYMSLELSMDGINFSSSPLLKWDESAIDEDVDSSGSATMQISAALPASYLTSNFAYRFRWKTNSSDNNHDGCFVDDIAIKSIGDGSGNSYVYSSGTSMASPMVAAAAALVWGYDPDLTSQQLKNTLLATGDSLASLSGKTVSGKRLNLYAAMNHYYSAKAITSFEFADLKVPVSATIFEDQHLIYAEVPYGTDVGNLVPTIGFLGSTISPASGVAQNFSTAVSYAVTAQDGTMQTYQVVVAAKAYPFPKLKVSLDNDTVRSGGKVKGKKVKFNFSNTNGATYFKISKNKNFKGASWKKIKKSITIELDGKKGDRTFYIKFKNAENVQSSVFKKKVSYSPPSGRSISVSDSRVRQGSVIVQSGKGFSKNNQVLLYFSKADGSYYPPKVVSTDKSGRFSLSYKINKAKGTYYWYAVDKKTGKKSKTGKYIVI